MANENPRGSGPAGETRRPWQGRLGFLVVVAVAAAVALLLHFRGREGRSGDRSPDRLHVPPRVSTGRVPSGTADPGGRRRSAAELTGGDSTGAAPEAATVLRGFVRRPEGGSLAGAAVKLLVAEADARSIGARFLGGREVAQAVSDEQGAFDMTWPLAESALATLETSLAGWITDRRPLSLLETRGEVLVTLHPGVALRGQVTTEKGEPVPDARIWAWDPLGPDPFRTIGQREIKFLGRDHVLVTNSDSRGEFRFEAVDENRTYRLVASAPDRIMRSPFREARTDGPPVTLELHPVYVAWAVFETEGGEPLLVNPNLDRADQRAVEFSMPASLNRMVFADSWRLRHSLAALPASVGTDRSTSHRFFLAFVPGDRGEKVGPISLDLRIPGYQRTKTEIWASRLDPAGARPTRIRLTAEAPGFGTLEVALVDVRGAALPRVHPGADQFRVVLQNTSATGPSLGLSLPTIGGPIHLVAGVPEGRYQARIISEIPGFEPSGSEIAIRAGATARLTIRGPRLYHPWILLEANPPERISETFGRIELQIRRVDGAGPWTRPIRRHILDYVVDDLYLPEGEYVLSILNLVPEEIQARAKDQRVEITSSVHSFVFGFSIDP